MSILPVQNSKGETVGEWDVADTYLVHDRGDQVLREALLSYQAAIRAGSASTLTKAEVSGSGKKPYRQKGTGRARAGYIRSPIRRGGGVAHGPKPRSYSIRLNKKAARLAFRRAFTLKVSGGEMVVLDSLSLPEPRTRHVAALHRKLGSPRSLLLVVPALDEGLWQATRNIPEVDISTAAQLGAVALMQFARVAVTKEAMTILEQRLQSPARRGA